MKKILIIEDEEIIRNLIKKKLVNNGFEVEAAENGKIGLEKLRSNRPDLILLDIIMPEMGGFDVLNDIQGTDLEEVPVVIVSNSGQPVEIDKAKDYGVEDWIVKTEFDPNEVVKKVVSLIGKPKNK